MMSKGPEAHAFDVVSAPIGTGSVEFQEITRRIGGIDTLEAFLRDMHQRYPDPPASDPSAAKAPPPPAKAPPDKAAAAPVKPDAKPTGSIARAR
jgi:hypothetical protein